MYFKNGSKWKVQDSLARSGDSSLRLKRYASDLNESVYLNYMLDISDASKYQFLSFWHIATMEAVDFGLGMGLQISDYGQVEISVDSGQTYVVIPASKYIGEANYSSIHPKFHEASYPGGYWSQSAVNKINSFRFKKETFNLSGYAGSGKTLMLRFRLKSNNFGSKLGWTIDDVKFEQSKCIEPIKLKDSAVVSQNKVFIKWDTLVGSENYEVEYGIQGFAIGSGTRSIVNRQLFKTINYSDLTENTVYDVYVRAKCSVSDSSAWVGPIKTAIPPSNATACNAILVNADGSLIQGMNYGVQLHETGETAAKKHFHTLWYKVVVPASRMLAITSCESDIEARVYVMDTSSFDCSDLSGLTHFRTDAMYPTNSIYYCKHFAQWERCTGLSVGDTLTFAVGSRQAGSTGRIKFRIHDQTLPDNPAGATKTHRACYGDTVNLYEVIEGESAVRTQRGNGTKWHYAPSNQAIHKDSMFVTTHHVTQKDSVRYIVNSACKQDTSYAIVKVASGSHSGEFTDTLETCNSMWISLFEGLSGVVQMGGTWSDDDNTTRINPNTGRFLTSGFSAGTYKFTYTVGGNPCTASSTQILVKVKNCVGIKENNQDVFRMYPNPSTGGVLYVSSKDLMGKAEVSIMNAKGQIVKIETLNLQSTNRIDVNDLPAGLYNVSIKHNTNIYNTSIIIK